MKRALLVIVVVLVSLLIGLAVGAVPLTPGNLSAVSLTHVPPRRYRPRHQGPPGAVGGAVSAGRGNHHQPVRLISLAMCVEEHRATSQAGKAA